MEKLLDLSFKTKVSFVVCILDDFNGERVRGGNLTVMLAESRKKPIRKKDGIFVFVDLEVMTYTLKIESDIYFSQSIRVDPDKIERLDPVIYVRLKPKLSYPFGSAATLMRGRIVDKAGGAVLNASVRAAVNTADCAKGRILQENVPRGSNTLLIAKLGGKISEGETLIIKEKDESKTEICKISCLYEDTNSFGLCEPLKFDHKRGVFLFLLTETVPDKSGEIVIYFYNIRVPVFEAELHIAHGGASDIKKFEVHAGGTYNFGTLKIM